LGRMPKLYDCFPGRQYRHVAVAAVWGRTVGPDDLVRFDAGHFALDARSMEFCRAMEIRFTLDLEELTAGRFLALGLNVRKEMIIAAAAALLLVGLMLSPWSHPLMPLGVGGVAAFVAYSLIQSSKVRDSALRDWRGDSTLRGPWHVAWSGTDLTFQREGRELTSAIWSDLRPLIEDPRVVVVARRDGAWYFVIPKRAFADTSTLDGLRVAMQGLE
jgi:hypothetical protein